MKKALPLLIVPVLAVALWRGGPEARTGSRRAPVVEPTASEEPAPEPERPRETPPERRLDAARAEAKKYRLLREGDATLEEIRAAEARLAALPPHELLEALAHETAPVVVPVLLGALDRGLEADRDSWEDALVVGVERAAEDPPLLERMAALAADRVRDPERREHLAVFLRDWASTDRLWVLTARFACGESLPELRAKLWDRGAYEALGWVVEPEDAVRLEAAGAVRALEIAWDRTRDPRFEASLRRLR